jgi:hypothetical protein
MAIDYAKKKTATRRAIRMLETKLRAIKTLKAETGAKHYTAGQSILLARDGVKDAIGDLKIELRNLEEDEAAAKAKKAAKKKGGKKKAAKKKGPARSGWWDEAGLRAVLGKYGRREGVGFETVQSAPLLGLWEVLLFSDGENVGRMGFSYAPGIQGMSPPLRATASVRTKDPYKPEEMNPTGGREFRDPKDLDDWIGHVVYRASKAPA